MRHEIEHPVAHDERGDHQRARTIPPDEVVRHAEQGGPDRAHQQAMRDRIVNEPERRERGVAGGDLDALEARKVEERPQAVDELRREEQRAERNGRHRPLGGERDRVVADQHDRARKIRPPPARGGRARKIPMLRRACANHIPPAERDEGEPGEDHRPGRGLRYRGSRRPRVFLTSQNIADRRAESPCSVLRTKDHLDLAEGEAPALERGVPAAIATDGVASRSAHRCGWLADTACNLPRRRSLSTSFPAGGHRGAYSSAA